MAIMFLDGQTGDEFLARVEKIQEDTPREWGTMDAAHMMAHLLRGVRVSLEEEESEDYSNFFLKHIMRVFAFHVPLPWPKGKIATVKGYTPEPVGTFEEQKQELLGAMKRFIEATQNTPDRVTPHPGFGPQTLEYWRRLHGTHFDHHLRQFAA